MTISIEALVGVCALVGMIAGAIIFIRRQAKDEVRTHNTDERSHPGIRASVDELSEKLDTFIEEDKLWKKETGKILLKISQNGHGDSSEQ